jgi:hypothetical protein
MDPSMRAIGKMIWLTVKEDSSTLTVMFMKESGLTTKLMVEEHTFIWTELSTLETGERTSNMALELRHGLMEQGMKETTSMERSTEPVLSSGQMVQCTSVNFTIITFMARVFTLGAMVVNMKVSGETTRCMEEELSHGLMAGSM